MSASSSPSDLVLASASGRRAGLLQQVGARFHVVVSAGALLVEGIRGCYSNVVGLPLTLLYRLLGQAGHDVSGWLGPDAVEMDG